MALLDNKESDQGSNPAYTETEDENSDNEEDILKSDNPS
jgi:hypothetical protein